MKRMFETILVAMFLCLAVMVPPAAAATTVVVKIIASGDLEERIPLSGEIRPYEEIHVSPDLGGRVEKIVVENGRPVKAGDPMIVIEHQRLQLAVDQAEISVRRAEQELRNKKKDFERRQILMAKKVLNEKAYDEAENDYIQARNALEAAKQALVLDRLNLERSTIRSPLSGVFVNRNVFLGQSVQPGMLLGKVVVLDKVYVEAKVPENRINRVKIGQRCSLENGASGTVAFVNLYGDESRSFLIRILVDNAQGQLKPNMFVKGDLVVGNYFQVPLVPIAAIAGTSDRPAVFVVVGNQARLRPIEVVARQGEIACVKGVEPGERIVTVGISGLADGAEVLVANDAERPETPGAGSGGTASRIPNPGGEGRAPGTTKGTLTAAEIPVETEHAAPAAPAAR